MRLRAVSRHASRPRGLASYTLWGSLLVCCVSSVGTLETTGRTEGDTREDPASLDSIGTEVAQLEHQNRRVEPIRSGRESETMQVDGDPGDHWRGSQAGDDIRKRAFAQVKELSQKAGLKNPPQLTDFGMENSEKVVKEMYTSFHKKELHHKVVERVNASQPQRGHNVVFRAQGTRAGRIRHELNKQREMRLAKKVNAYLDTDRWLNVGGKHNSLSSQEGVQEARSLEHIARHDAERLRTIVVLSDGINGTNAVAKEMQSKAAARKEDTEQSFRPKVVEDEPAGDLGEGIDLNAGVDTGKLSDEHKKQLLQKISEAQQRTQEGVDTIIANSRAAYESYKLRMNERIEKAVQWRIAQDRKADELQEKAPNDWKVKHEQEMHQKKENWNAIQEKGSKHLAELEEKAVTKNQQSAMHWMQKITAARQEVSNVRNQLKAWYLDQVAILDEVRRNRIAEARTNFEQESAKARLLVEQSREGLQSESRMVRKKYEDMIKHAEQKKSEALKKLHQVEDEAIASAKETLRKSTEQEALAVSEAESERKQAVGEAELTITAAKNAKRDYDSERDLLQKFNSEYKARLVHLSEHTSEKITMIKRQTRIELVNIENTLRQTHNEAVRQTETQLNKIANQSDSVDHQMESVETARKNAKQNCEDARQEADLKAAAAKYAAHRVSRGAQTEMVIAKNREKDEKKRANQLEETQDKYAAELQKTTEEAAIAMAKAMYQHPAKGNDTADVPCDELSLDVDNFKIPDESKLDKASEEFAEAYIPVDKEKPKLELREKQQKKAHDMAMEKTLSWAEHHATKVAHEAKAEAEEQCAKSAEWFAKFESTAKEHMGDMKEARKAEKKNVTEQSKEWEQTKVTELNQEKTNITRYEQTEITTIEKHTHSKKVAIEKDYEAHVSSIRTKEEEYQSQYEQLHAKGQLRLKLAQDKSAASIDEAQRLHHIIVKEAESMQNNAKARTLKEAQQLDIDTQRDIDETKMQMSSTLERLQDNLMQDPSGGPAAGEERKLRVLSEKAIEEANEVYEVHARDLKGKQAAKEAEEETKEKQTVSIYEEKKKEEMNMNNEFIEKAILKEKHEQRQVEEAKERDRQHNRNSMNNFEVMSSEKASTMKSAAREKERQDIAEAKKAFNVEVDTEQAKRTAEIKQIEANVLKALPHNPS